MHEPDNHELLAEYTRNQSEKAFAILVARHINLVYSVALRHVTSSHQAEEITQVVFLLLARKAARISPKTILSGWLYRTAQLTAANYLRMEKRRLRREQEIPMQSLMTESEPDIWAKIAPQLDNAIVHLGDRERDAIILRFFEGKSFREIADALGASENTTQKRVERALEKLRNFFTKRGLTLSVDAFTLALSAHSVQAAPAALIESSIAVGITNGATVSGPSLFLMKSTLKIMAWFKIKTAVLAAISTILVAGTATVAIAQIQKEMAGASPSSVAATADNADTIIYRASVPDKVWEDWADDVPQTRPATAPIPTPEHFEIVEHAGANPRTFSGKVVLEGPMDGVEVGLVSLIDIQWLHPDAYQWERVAADGTFSITDKNYLDKSKALAVRGPNTPWTFLRYDFKPNQGGRNIVLNAVPGKKVRLTASGADMVNLTNVSYERFDTHSQYDDEGKYLHYQRMESGSTDGADHLDLILPVGQSALFVHSPGFADYFQIVDTTKASHLHFVMLRAGGLKVTVLNIDGKPKSGVGVRWYNANAALSLCNEKTDEDGVATQNHLVPGTFHVFVDGFPEKKVNVKEGEVTEIVLQDGKTL